MEVKAEIDIRKIIDDAMEKKDRTVNIYISKTGTSVYVNPIREEDEPHWIDITPEPPRKTSIKGHEYVPYIQRMYRCSHCGYETHWVTPYCPICGEQMHGTRKEGKK